MAISGLTYDELLFENTRLKSEINNLRRLIFGQKRERFVPASSSEQLSLVHPPLNIAKPKTEQITYTRKKASSQRTPHGRSKLPGHLSRRKVLIEPESDVTGLKKIGEEITEELEYAPGTMYVVQYIRSKYAKANDSGVVIGELPHRPIDKGIAGPGLLSHMLISKFVDHIPLNRQLKQFRRQDVRIPSSTLNGWLKACCDLLVPLERSLRAKTLQGDYLQADETTVKVQDPHKKGKTHNGYFWLYHNPARRLLFYDYRAGRGRDGPSTILKDFSGYLQTDGYRGYDEITMKNDLVRLGCMAHARRKFYEAKDHNPEHAEWMLRKIRALYDLERRARQNEFSVKERFELRHQYARPLFDSIKSWLDAEIIRVSPKTDLGVAIRYMTNQWLRLNSYLLDGRLEIDNNLIENAVRPVTLGRKNWLFAGSHESARQSALVYSLVGTARLHGVEPWQYLKDVLMRINDHPIKNIDQLLPHNWKCSDTSLLN
jgi:transposase